MIATQASIVVKRSAITNKLNRLEGVSKRKVSHRLSMLSWVLTIQMEGHTQSRESAPQLSPETGRFAIDLLGRHP